LSKPEQPPEENAAPTEVTDVPVEVTAEPPIKKTSNNPLGRPKKEATTSAKTKEDLFRAFQQAGGLARLVKLIEAKKIGKTKESRSKAAQADKLFLDLAFNVLPRMVPKETSIDIETKSVIFQFTDRNPEEIRVKDDRAIDIEFNKEP
jgi:hypothetical protein